VEDCQTFGEEYDDDDGYDDHLNSHDDD